MTVPDAHFPHSSCFSRDSHSVLAPLLGHLLGMLLLLFVVLFTCGDAGGVKRAIERALEAADTGGASSSAGESHVQQLGGGVRRCLRQEDQPQLPLLSNLRRHWAEGSMSSVTVCAWHERRSECWARRTTAKELAPRLDDAVRGEESIRGAPGAAREFWQRLQH